MLQQPRLETAHRTLLAKHSYPVEFLRTVQTAFAPVSHALADALSVVGMTALQQHRRLVLQADAATVIEFLGSHFASFPLFF